MRTVLIIPAAGRGTRLQTSLPKVLVPVAGRPMLDHLLDRYAPVVDRVVVVLHPSAVGAVRAHCRTRGIAIDLDVQDEPTGMLDAILVPLSGLRRRAPDRVWVTWCDQLAVRPATVAALVERSRLTPNVPLIFPTVHRPKPYVHLERDTEGRIVAIRHQREGDLLPEIGESEIGLFSLSGQAYVELLPAFAETVEVGSTTRERNFLPFIPWVAGRGGVETFPCGDPIESVGINTRADLELVEQHLARSPS